MYVIFFPIVNFAFQHSGQAVVKGVPPGVRHAFFFYRAEASFVHPAFPLLLDYDQSLPSQALNLPR